MKKTTLLLLLLTLSFGVGAFEFKDKSTYITLDVPDDYTLVENLSGNEEIRAIFSGTDSKYIQIFFFEVDIQDRSTAILLPDASYFVMDGFEKLEKTKDLEGCDKATTYYHPHRRVYSKYYRNEHFSGISYIIATAPTNDFAEFDEIVSTYKRKNAFWLSLLDFLISIISIGLFWLSGHRFRKGGKKSIILGIISLLFAIVCTVICIHYFSPIIWALMIMDIILFFMGLFDTIKY